MKRIFIAAWLEIFDMSEWVSCEDRVKTRFSVPLFFGTNHVLLGQYPSL